MRVKQRRMNVEPFQQEASQDLDDYKQYLKDEGKYKKPFETVKGFFRLPKRWKNDS